MHPARELGATAGQTLRRAWGRPTRRIRETETGLALLLCVASLLIGVAQHNLPVPLTALLVPMVVGNLLLAPRTLPWTVLFTFGVLLAVTLARPSLLEDRGIGAVVVICLVGLIIMAASFRRSRLGVAGSRGESMLVDLRDRIAHQGQLPPLPFGWSAETVLRSAGGTSFAGDFLVASSTPDGRSLQVVVVDVSGKGVQAGSRSLLLSGAFGGLLGALPPEAFLPAANDYLLRQDWSEGFATAVHLSLDLGSGDFELRSAGHPPAVQLLSGSGRWAIHEAEGPVLGLIPGASFSVVPGRISPGDAMLLFTDGLVETPQRDIALGIDKLLGQGERLLRGGFEGGARRLADALETRNDDRALLLLHRREATGQRPVADSERMTGIEPA